MFIFAELTSPEVIAAISAGVAAIITALGTLIYKYRQAKKIDFKQCGIIIKQSQKLMELFKKPKEIKK